MVVDARGLPHQLSSVWRFNLDSPASLRSQHGANPTAQPSISDSTVNTRLVAQVCGASWGSSRGLGFPVGNNPRLAKMAGIHPVPADHLGHATGIMALRLLILWNG